MLVIGERRQTEPNYFTGLRGSRFVRARFAVAIKRGTGQSPDRVVEEAITHKERAHKDNAPYDEIWCVLDVEGRSNRRSLDKAVELAQKNGIKLCLSNPSFEVWLLSHFERTAKRFRDGKAVIALLATHWRNHCGREYRKNDKRLYSRVSQLTETAIDNARWVREKHHGSSANTADCNSSTDVYRLVDHLISEGKK